jgi:diguanylate cyclase (GGDEF)-like protein
LNREIRDPATATSVADILQEERSLYSTQFTLGFSSLQFIPELEDEFREYYLRNSPGHLKRVLPIALALTVLFALSNYVRLPTEVFQKTMLLPYAQLAALALVAVVIYRDYRRALEPAVILTLSVYGITTPIAMGAINEGGQYSPIAAQLFIIVFCYFLSGLRFVPAMVGAMVISLSYPASQLLFDTPLHNLALNSYYLLLFNLLGLTGAYFFEYAARDGFLSRALMQEMALYDSVTGLPNQRAFALDLDRLCRQGRRDAKTVAVAMLDVDNFKEFNDYFGYPQGDYCLRKISSAVRGGIRRPLDIAGRYGGEELVIAWYDCNAENARDLAESVRAEVESLAIPHGPEASQRSVTVSIGVISSVPGEKPDASSLMRGADRALADAKEKGRNQVSDDARGFKPRPL